MYYERVINLLFATTLIVIFSYLLAFVALGQAVGNGGEYWGFDGNERARDAAERMLARGDQRLLRIDITDPLDNRLQETPIETYCGGSLFGTDLPIRIGTTTPLHGRDSFKKAGDFAFEYNNTVAWELGTAEGRQCLVGYRRISVITIDAPDGTWMAVVVIGMFYIALPLLIYLLWPGRRFYRDKLRAVQEAIRKREEKAENKQEVQDDLAKERRSRRHLRRVHRFFPRRE
ncbi:MAG: hypothetical protein AAF351_01250 [Pseudomonadota bacterium]